MGSQKSQEESSLVTVLQPNEFAILESKSEWQLWEDRISTRRYMVFTLDDTALSQHNLQVYHFRKLNRAYLAGVHALCQDDPGICARPQRTMLMLDHLPYILGDFGRILPLNEGLTVLQAALAGYRIMSYLFGPLLCSPDMIHFTESGVPKVWANEQLQRNEPSPSALEEETPNGKQAFPSLGIAQKKVDSIRSILRTVASVLNLSLPQEFLKNFERARSYEEAQQVLELYCRREGIQLQQWIESRPIFEKRTPLMSMNSGAFLSKVSSELPITSPNAYNNTLAIRNQNIQHHYQQINPPVQQQIIQPVIHNYSQNQPIIRPQYVNDNKLPHIVIPPVQRSVSQSKVTVQPVVTETIITSFPIESQRGLQQDLRPPPQLKTAKVSVDERTMQPIAEIKEMINEQPPKAGKRQQEHILIEQSHPLEQSGIPTKNEISSSQISQSSHEIDPEMEENYHLIVHQITDNSHSQNNEVQIHDKTIEMEHAESDHVTTPEVQDREEIDRWDENMQKVKKVTSRQSSDYYRSEERDQVVLPESLPETPPQHDITDFKSEDELEKYIRNKYSEYFTEKEPVKGPTHHHTNSLDKQLFEKKVVFANVADKEEEDQEDGNPVFTAKFDPKPSSFHSLKKYTFGNIEPEPVNTYSQNQQTFSYPPKDTSQQEAIRKKRADEDAINARYSKYVVNRSGKNIKKRNEAPQSQFGRDRVLEGNSYDELRRLLKQ